MGRAGAIIEGGEGDARSKVRRLRTLDIPSRPGPRRYRDDPQVLANGDLIVTACDVAVRIRALAVISFVDPIPLPGSARYPIIRCRNSKA